jgi:hypothetical protein
VLEHQIYRPELATTQAATDYGLTWLTKYGASQEIITFDVDIFGLQPGTMLAVNAPTLGVTAPDLGVLLENSDDLLAQNAAYFAQEVNGVVGRYVIQSVRYAPLPVVGGVLLRATVTAGEYEHTLLDMLKPVVASQQTAPSWVANQLSDISPVFGEIVAGRAVLTDGGTAAFDWSAYNAHSGVVLGLDATTATPRGNLLVLDGGTVRAKLGYMPGMGDVGTVTPTGWGIWTQNGYFQGIVAASTIAGGTVTGGLISGGTVTGARVTGGTVSGAVVTGGTVSGNLLVGTAGTIGGFTIENNKLWASSGTIQTGSVVNSSNPGVRLEPAGLFGYGTAGLTFALYSDPALRPYFSSGTITNVVYEVTTTSIIRTGVVNPRVQIDNSGIFAYGPTGVLKFQVDAATGLLTASDGIFSGSVNASRITGGTVSGGYVTGGTIESAFIKTPVGGTIDASVVTVNNLNASNITSGTISATRITGGTMSANYLTAGTINASNVTINNLNASNITAGTISANRITGGGLDGSLVSITNLNASNITSGTINALKITGGTVSGAVVTTTQATMQNNGVSLLTGTVDSSYSGYNSLMWHNSGSASIGYITHGYDPSIGAFQMKITADAYSPDDQSEIYFVNPISCGEGVRGDLRPTNNNDANLGIVERGWKGLYLYDWDDNVVRYVYLNNGVLTVAI